VNVLGIWDGHDAGAALLQHGRLRVAINEERLTRRKLEVRFPSRAIAACLAVAGIAANDVDVVAASTTDPAKALARVWPGSKERYYGVRRRKTPPGRWASTIRRLKYRMTEWGPSALSTSVSRATLARTLAAEGLGDARLELVDHHDAHAAGAAWGSGPGPRTVVTIDGLGDGLSHTVSSWRDGVLTRVARSPAHASLGVFFEHVTSLLNMRELEDEGKVMALADYASPIADADNPLLGLVRVSRAVIETARPGHALRSPLAAVHWRYPNEQFAYMAQRVVERTVVDLGVQAATLTGIPRLALAGGVVSNVKATRRLRLDPAIEDVYVMPHMGDGGLALGAAVLAAARGGDTVSLDLRALGLGPEYDPATQEAAIRAAGLVPVREDAIGATVAARLASGQVVMWFQGRMEYGPRALGHRSVLARPDRIDLRDRLNLVLKRRVWYQPFCPTLLESERARLLSDWRGDDNANMTMAYEVAPAFRPSLVAVTSIDGTCRPQFVPDGAAGPFPDLLREAQRLWGVGVVLNTSFNIHGEPLVCTPTEAVDVFVRSGADALAMGPFLVERPATGPTVTP
jgi:carbamoyltransferase